MYTITDDRECIKVNLMMMMMMIVRKTSKAEYVGTFFNIIHSSSSHTLICFLSGPRFLHF